MRMERLLSGQQGVRWRRRASRKRPAMKRRMMERDAGWDAVSGMSGCCLYDTEVFERMMLS